MPKNEVTRRDFVSSTSKAVLGASIVPRHVLGGVGYQAPSDTLNVAIVGAGGMGAEDAQELGSENIIAVCDVDFPYVERRVEDSLRNGEGEPREKGVRWKEQFTRAARYNDYREMIDKQTDLDAVVIATPDHAHAVIAKEAMEAGLHVYVQKPLTWSVHEARVLQETAARTGVVTQMGNQGHSSDDARLINEWIQAGVIGPVREVHIWTNRPIWPQGVPQPHVGPPADNGGERGWGQGDLNARLAEAMGGEHAMPPTFDWDLYRGPIADNVPFHPIYHPFNWRGWVPFGIGALGDMGAHLVDHPYWALDLEYPISVEATSSPWGGGQRNPVSYPLAMTAHYVFPSRRFLPPVDMYWYDGGLMPPRPELLPDDVALDRTGGVLFVGEWGLLMHETYGDDPRLFPEGLMEEAATVPQTYARVEETHEMNWALACKGEGAPTCPFEYAAPLTEVMILGIVALRAGQGQKILYDGEKMRITNVEEANQYLRREYRDGWSV